MPYNRCFEEIGRLRRFVRIALDALGDARDAVKTVALLRRAAVTIGMSSPLLDEGNFAEAKKHARDLQSFAREQADLGFEYVFALAIVRVWTILEVLVDEMAGLCLSTPDRWGRLPALESLRGPLVEFLQASAEQRVDYLLDELKLATKAKLKKGAGRFEVLLDSVGLGGPVEPEARRALLELSAVRNVIVHKNGRADARLLQECPWLNVKVGDRLRISERSLDRYVTVVAWYASELARRWHLAEGDQWRETQEEFRLEMLRELKALERPSRSRRPARKASKFWGQA